MTTIYLSFGSNIGNRLEQIKRALQMLEAHGEIKVNTCSSIYETAPVGGVKQDDFLNGVVEIESTLEPMALLEVIQNIELELKRERKIHWGPRTIDLDILLYGDEIIEEARLKVPHPYMHERSFVLIPLNEIAPDAYHPVLKKKVKDLIKDDPDVRLYK